MMDCKKLREILDLYVDHELSPDAYALANFHIAECAGCRRAVESLCRLREGIKAAVGTPELSPELSERLRAMISPPWYRASVLKALAATLAAALVLAVFVPTVRGEVVSALDFLSFKLDGTRQVVMEGTLLCRDQQLARQYGYPAMCRITGHHGWLVTSDGRFWSILEGNASRDLIHDSSLLGRHVKIEGRMFRKAGSIEVSSYQLL